MHVAGEQDGASAGIRALAHAADQPRAFGRISIPLVVVHDAPVEDGVPAGRQSAHPAERSWPVELELVDHDTAGHERPRAGRVAEAFGQPRALLVAEERSVGVVEGLGAVVAGLAVPTDEAGVEEDQLGGVADGDGPPRLDRSSAVAAAHGQPLLPGPNRRCHPIGPWTVGRRIVALRPVAPRVVTEVVVVPDGHHRMTEVQRLGIGIGTHLGQAPSVVVERHRLVGRLVSPVSVRTSLLVDVVAEVQDEIDLALGQRPVHAERRFGEVRTTDRAEAEPIDGTERQGPRPPDRRVHARCREAVPVARGRLEVADVDDDREVRRGIGGALPGGDHDVQVWIARDDPRDRRRLTEPGPQEHRRGRRFERRHGMGERHSHLPILIAVATQLGTGSSGRLRRRSRSDVARTLHEM